jgi:prepilin-type N-terminal cleavage/methylation domain-containing protein
MKKMPTKLAIRKINQRGFTLMEVLVATVLLLTGIVAVAQLVPVAVTANNGNRRDSTATVIAQRELAQMLEQPLTSPGPFTDALGNVCNLGDANQPGVTVGSPVVIIANRPAIDFSAGKVANYSFNTPVDPEDPYGAQYDVRWAVITSGNGGNASSRRFIISARRVGGNGFYLPLTLDAMVQR